MDTIINVIETIKATYTNQNLVLSEILAMLIMILLISLYEFVVYRIVSHRTFYNRSFHISILVIPFLIGAIIKCLQSDLVITLGTIGALAIIRFRTAVKDPVDTIYILWSVFIGICCGCSLYELCVLTSLIITMVMLLANYLNCTLLKNPYCLVLNCKSDIEDEINGVIKKYSKSYRLKSRNFISTGVDYVYELKVDNEKEFLSEIKDINGVSQFSLIEYDNNDVI